MFLKVKIKNDNDYDVSFAQVGRIPKKSTVEKELCDRIYNWLKRSSKVTVSLVKDVKPKRCIEAACEDEEVEKKVVEKKEKKKEEKSK